MSPTPRARRAALGLLTVLVLLAGCSASGSDDGADGAAPASTSSTTSGSSTADPSTTTTEAEAEETTTTEGGGGAPSSKQAYIDAVAETMRDVEDSDFPIDDDQADCLAPRWVDAIGYETLLDAGVTPEVLGGSEDGDTTAEFEDVVDRPRAEKLVDAFGACGIDLDEFFYDSLTSDGSATADQVECLRGRLPDEFVRDLMVTSMDGGDDALDADPDLEGQLTDAFMACLADG